jgi:hypothetical protein
MDYTPQCNTTMHQFGKQKSKMWCNQVEVDIIHATDQLIAVQTS